MKPKPANIWRVAAGSCAIFLMTQLTAPAQTLVNRWSFNGTPGNTTVTDAVSSVVATLQGNASLDGAGNVSLDGSGGTYVNLSSNLLVGMQAVSCEGWVNSAASPDNVCLFSFDDGEGQGNDYARYVLHDSGNSDNQFELAQLGSQPNQRLKSPVGWGGVPVHVVCVYDPTVGIQAIYTNGILEAFRSFPTNQTALSSVSTNAAALGRSPWWAAGDPYLAGTISEFRIWNGQLNGLQVAALDTAGAATVSTNYGTVTSLQLQVTNQLARLALQQAVVLASASALSVDPDIASICSYNSGNTNILTVSATGLITAVAPGSATITATFGAFSSSQTITVFQPPAFVLGNRWSFNAPAGSLSVTDSVGGVIATLQGNARLDGAGNVILDGTSGTYVNLGSGLLTGLSAVTFDAWFTYTIPNDNVHLFSFDNGDGTGSGGSYFRYNIHDSGNGNGGTNYVQDIVGWGGATLYGGMVLPQNVTNHVTIVYDPENEVQTIYLNGLLKASSSGSLNALSGIPANSGTLGESPWRGYGDPYLNGTISEFRIWSGALTYSNVVASDAAGPNALPGAVPLTIVSQPMSPPTALSPGQSVSLSVNAFSSSQPITYQWATGPVAGPYVNLSNGTLGDGAIISGVTSNVLTIANLTLAENTNYVVKISDSTGTNVTSSLATVIVVSAPVVILDTTPSSLTNYSTKTGQFYAAFSGSQPISYQWQVSTNGGTNYYNVNDVNVSGAATTNLIFNNLQLAEAGLYRLQATNANGAASSSPAQLTVVDISQALYNWQTPVSINGLTAAQILNGVPGVYFEACGLGGGLTVTVGGTSYVFDSSGSSCSIAPTAGNDDWGSWNTSWGFGGDTGNANLNYVLGHFWYDGGVHNITIHNLTPGTQYSAQLFASDDRQDSPPENIRQSNYQDPANSLDVSATFAMGNNVYVIGTFTATSTDMTIQQNLLTGGSGNINAVVIRTLPLTVDLQPSGSNLQLNWSYGTLLEATNVAGPWIINNATSPYTVTPTEPQKFYRVQTP